MGAAEISAGGENFFLREGDYQKRLMEGDYF